MEFYMEHWYIIVALLALATGTILALIRFSQLPSDEQLAKVREWLLYAVTEAERELGGGTGQLKLRSVYDMFVLRFPKLVALISFDLFSELVDEALVDMREMLEKNQAVKAIVVGDSNEAV